MRTVSIFVVATFAIATGCVADPSSPSSSKPGPAAPASESSPTAEAAGAPGSLPAGCSLPDLGVDLADEDDDGEPYGGYSTPIAWPILRTGRQVASIANADIDGLAPVVPKLAPRGLSAQAVVVHDGSEGAPSSIASYYSSKPITETTTSRDVFVSGGATFVQEESTGKDAALVVEAIGDRATVIRVGDYDAAITHGTTMPGTSIRTWAIYWSDGKSDFALIVNGSAKDAIEAAQSIYCS